ncbi:MAG: PilT protein domain protein [Chloroflexi bacterium]|nr:PilT protein domain protein [Chloroflexota bacterium]
MRVLLDTHAFLWWLLDAPELSADGRRILSDGSNEVLLSAVSGYELSYKVTQARLTLPEAPDVYVRSRLASNGFGSLAIELDHALRAATLPLIHRDPFDRLLVAQAQLEGIPIITRDPVIAQYDVEVIW